MSEKKKPQNGTYASLTGFRRAIPIILIAVAVFIGLCFITQNTGALGRAISRVLLGLFSVGGYFIPAILLVHAFFYPSDYHKKTVISRIIFSIVAVIFISAMVHSFTIFNKDVVFNAKQLYADGILVKGGGFIGGLVAWVLSKLFGSVGVIIIAILVFALYITYFFSGGKSALSRFLLKIVNWISDVFTTADDKKKKKEEARERKKELRKRASLAGEQEALLDDEFFEADNGLKELTITELGIKEVRDDSELEKRPDLKEKVVHGTEGESQTYTKKTEDAETDTFGSDSTGKRRSVNMDYSTTDSRHEYSDSVKNSGYTPSENDIVYEEPKEEEKPTPKQHTPYSSGESAEEVFGAGFDPFDVKLNQELANKPSSKAKKEPEEPEGISEFTTPINKISPEDVEKARQRADFEMKKKAAIDAMKRYSEAETEIVISEEPKDAYIPDYMKEETAFDSAADNEEKVEPVFEVSEEADMPDSSEEIKYEQANDNSEPELEPEPTAQEYRTSNYRRAAEFAGAINKFNTDSKPKETFKPYVPPKAEDIDITAKAPKQEDDGEMLKMTRSMLDPTPTITRYDYPEEAAEGDDSAAKKSEEITDSVSVGMEFDFDDGTEEDETDIIANIAKNGFSEDAPSSEDEESDEFEERIPEEEQNPVVKEYRKSFPFLDDEETEEEENTEADGFEANIPEESPDGSDIATDGFDAEEEVAEKAEEEEDDDDDIPFEVTPRVEITQKPEEQKTPPKPEEPKKPDYSDYKFPPLDLLVKGKTEEDPTQEEEKNLNAEKLVDTLMQFNIRISIKGVDRGPRITRYEIVPARGVKVNSITNLFNDIALNLGVEGIRMEAPIPGKSAIGVEIPNKKPSTVLLRDLVESDEFICADSKTMSCLGKDVTGNPVFADIAKMPHILVAGATGMGKSVCINSILISILYKAKPDEVKFIMIDPKKVEFNGYNGIPHLLVPVVTDVKQAAGALMWAVEQMEKRYDLMEALEVRKLDAYNEKVRENPSLGEPLPKIIIVIDELNDIMIQVRKPAEDLIMSIAQKARAAGIHLIIGTQRPSVDVITGVIKANIPSRISCKVASFNDSKTILEQAGAEKLLNNGDMLYIPAGAPKALRVQGAFVSDGEVAAVMKFLKSQAKGDIYDAQALEDINRAAQKCSKGGKGGDDFDDDDGDDGESVGVLNDQQFLDAVDLAIKSGKISTSLIQRKISIGYGKAAKYIDIMEEMGLVSEPNGQRPRDVLVTKDEWHEMLSRRSLD